MVHNRKIRVLGATLGVAVLAASATIWLAYHNTIVPERPDTISAETFARITAADPDLPLHAQHTDVLLMAVCTLRTDRIGVYGNTQPTTPFIDKLARSGVWFKEHFSQAPWTRPGMGALVTGRWPRVLRLDDPNQGSGFTSQLHPDHTTLAEHLKAHNYVTVGASANPNLKAMFGLAQGFDHYHEPAGTYKERPHIANAQEIVDEALALANQVPRDRRLYMRVNVLDGHKPTQDPEKYWPLFMGEKARLRHYDSALRSIDAQLARLVAELHEDRPNLLVVVAADHGEGLSFPRHHGPEHGNHLYRSTTQTPWIVFHPSLPNPGREIGGLSMNIDVVPTILDLLGLAATEELDGASQKSAVLDQTDKASHEAVYAETYFRRVHKSMVYDGAHQLIRKYRGTRKNATWTDALYTAADIAARKDVASTSRGRANTLGKQLSAWEQHMAEMAGAAPILGPADIDDSTDQMLKDLGYVDE